MFFDLQKNVILLTLSSLIPFVIQAQAQSQTFEFKYQAGMIRDVGIASAKGKDKKPGSPIGSASIFKYGNDIFVLSNEHVLEKADCFQYTCLELHLVYEDPNTGINRIEHSYPLEFIGLIPRPRDLALLKVRRVNNDSLSYFSSLKIDNIHQFSETKDVYVITGHPSNESERRKPLPPAKIDFYFLKSYEKFSSSFGDPTADNPDVGIKNLYKPVKLESNAEDGMSGGPILSASNQLVGVYVGDVPPKEIKNDDDKNLRLGIRPEIICDLLVDYSLDSVCLKPGLAPRKNDSKEKTTQSRPIISNVNSPRFVTPVSSFRSGISTGEREPIPARW